MEQLTIIGSEESALILADETGQRFTLPVDDLLRSEIRKATRDRSPVKPLGASPREIQAHIRAGIAADEVARLLSIDVEAVRRFEGPVLAEREHIVDQVLSVPVVMATEFDLEENPTFGSAIRAKLADLAATGERWTSWKDENGWTVKLEFTASDVDHDARWSFEPRRSALSPLNSDATQLSQQGPLPEGLIPRLRALDSPAKDLSQFDSDAFGPRAVPDAEDTREDASDELVSGAAVRDAATKRAPESSTTTPETADLLEALRRRRGQRETAPMSGVDESASRHPARGSAPVSLFDAPGVSRKDDEPAPVAEAKPQPEPAPSSPPAKPDADSSAPRRRSSRASMPSWDEIVFGARSDD